MRVFVPGTGPLLQQWVSADQVHSRTAHAVTPALRAWLAEADAEELEYVALVEAAEASLRLIGADPAAAYRRVVIAADVEMAIAPKDADNRSLVRVAGPIPMAHVVSVHVDDDSSGPFVLAVVEALGSDPVDDADLAEVLDAAAERDLMWFDVTEVAQVVDLLVPDA